MNDPQERVMRKKLCDILMFLQTCAERIICQKVVRTCILMYVSVSSVALVCSMTVHTSS